jgi:hypothetical protein
MRVAIDTRQQKEKQVGSPKPDSPQYYWFNVIDELQALVSSTDYRYDAYFNLLFGAVDSYCIPVSVFCAGEQPPQVVPTLDDYLAGTWIPKLTKIALASVYYKLCQEGIDSMLQVSRTLLSSELANLATTPIELVPAQGDGVIIQPLSCTAHYNYGTVPFTTIGNLKLKRDPAVTDIEIPGDLLTASVNGTSYQSAANLDKDAVALDNVALQVSSDGTVDTGGGDSTCTLTVYYALAGV